jgi:glycosyltransferase involved in cell wall biosynthesis
MSLPVVSVVIPLFQKAPYVRRCLESVAVQTFRDYEVIVVDDGSSDGGGEFVHKLADPRFRLIRQDNAGHGAARNRGIAESQSEWVAFLDADDEWHPEFLEATLALSRRHAGLVSVFTNVTDGKTLRPLLQTFGQGLVPDYFEFLLANHDLGMTSMATLARRAALASCGAFRVGLSVGEDHDAFSRLAWTGAAAYEPRALAIYHRGVPGCATESARVAMPVFPATVSSYREWRRQGLIPPALASSSQRLADHMILDYAATLINRGQRLQALRILDEECDASAVWTPRYLSLCLRRLLPTGVHAGLRVLAGRLEAPQINRRPSPSLPSVAIAPTRALIEDKRTLSIRSLRCLRGFALGRVSGEEV